MPPKKPKWGDEPNPTRPRPPLDRLTSLPDPLRLHILTFLPYKSAVVTGALSSPWRGLWTHRWPHPSNLSLVPSSPHDPLFARHVDLLLLLLLRHVNPRRHDLLHISPPASASHSDLRRWLDYAAATSVSDLSVDLSSAPTIPLYLKFWAHTLPPGPTAPDASDTDTDIDDEDDDDDDDDGVENASLIRLKLSSLALMLPPPPTLKNFPNLEILNLTSVRLLDSALNRLVSACPLLRALELRCCRTLTHVFIPSSAEHLASVLILGCNRVRTLVVHSRNVKKLRFCGKCVEEFSLDEVWDLEDVYVSCECHDTLLPETNWMEALTGMLSVRVLTLCSLSLQCITIAGVKTNTDDEFRTFGNLKELQLVMLMMTETDLMDILHFFRVCFFPSLEKLFLEFPTHMHDPYLKNFFAEIKEDPLPESVFSNLKLVKVSNFNGHRYEMKLVSFLLSKATKLEWLIIIAPQEYSSRGECSNSAGRQLQNLCAELSQMAAMYSSKAQIFVGEHDDYRVRPPHFHKV